MNEWLNLPDGGWWYVAGWTMLHFLWLGTLVGLAAGVCRLVMRRASASFRYVTALACFALLAALPFGIAAMLVENYHRSSHVFQQVGVDEATGRPILHRVAVTPPWLRKPAPDSAGGLTGALSAERAVSSAPIVSRELETISSAAANPRQSRGLADVIALIAGYLPWAWLVGTPLTFVLLATGVAGAERLRRTSRVIDDGSIAEACARIVESLRIGRRVTVAVCERIASPVLVGIVRPIILLPPAALTGWSPDEIEMVLLHELAHVRRWDNLVNLMQRFVESLLFFHPAVWLVSSWVRSERETCCDAVVVGRTNQPHAYAEMLVALAAQMPRSVLFHPAASSAMAAGPLRGRIRRILGLQDDPMLVSGKSLGVVMSGLLFVATVLVLNLPQQTTAEEPAQQAAEQIDKEAEMKQAIAQVEATNQLKYLALALHVYHDAKGAFPAVASYDAQGRPLLSWRVHILPYLDGNAAGGGTTAELYKEFHLDEPWDSEHNRKLIPRMPAVFRNPTGAESDFTNYRAAVGPDCVFDGSAKGIKLSQIPDGTSNRVMVVEADEAVEWTKPDDFHFNPATPKAGLGALRPNGWNAAFADGSIHRIDQDESDGKVRDLFTCGRTADPLELPKSGHTSTSTSAKFPSLEDQKLADAAYRRLGLELEAIGDADLQRVKALGYEGGLLVTANNCQVFRIDAVIKGDILVGLYVWPTNSIQELLTVLSRGDLAELNPLKYYLVRSVKESGGGFGMESSEPRDVVITGRISVPPGVLPPSPPPMPQPVPHYSPYEPPVLQPVQGLPVPTIPNAVEPVSRIPAAQAPMAQFVIDPREIALDPNLQGRKPERWLPPPALAAPAPDPLTEREKQQLKAAGGVRIEFFYVSDSPACRRALELLPKYEEAFAGLLKIERINADEQPAAAKEAGIKIVPAYKLYLGERPVLTRTGEMSVAELDSTLASIARHEAMEPTVSMVKQQPELRYAGKTFDEWRTIWQTELSLERRLEVVKALAAFGASGRGKEAAAAILEVANQLDWTSLDNTPAGNLKQGCIDAFTTGNSTEGYRIPTADWWPLVVPIYENSPEKSTIVTYLAYQLPAGEKSLIPKLLELSNQDEATRKLAMEGLKAVDPSLSDDRVVARLRQSLKELDTSPVALQGAIRNLLFSPSGNFSGGMGQDVQLRMVPELQSLLFHPDLEVRQAARYVITKAQPKDAAALVEYLVHIIDTQGNGRERHEAIRALAALGSRAAPAEAKLKAIAHDPKDAAQFSAAMALKSLWPEIEDWSSRDRIKKLFKTEPDNIDDFDRKLDVERQEIFGVYQQTSVGGGGGMF